MYIYIYICMYQEPPAPQKCVPSDFNLKFHLEVNLEDCHRT